MIVLDTTVLIDLLRGHTAAAEYLERLSHPPACSEITRVELLRGLRHPEREPAERLMRAVQWIRVDEHVARRAGLLGRKWRRSHSLAAADLVVAATAQELGAKLATSNVRHFPMFERLEPPY